MLKSGTALTRNAGRALLLIVVSAVMAACNLGPQAPEVSPTATPLLAAPQAITPTFTVTPLIINVTPTWTPTPESVPAEQLGPITVDGTTHRTLDTVTVHVRVGTAVSAVNCWYSLQDTSQTTVLTSPTTTVIDTDTSENVYTFSPQAAGTYVVNCTGVALTVSGSRPVSGAGTPFAVEAKG